MKQKVTVSKGFSDLSNNIKICGVYQKDNTLIAVTRIIPTNNMGEAICTRTDSMTVETNSNRDDLAVKAVFISDDQTLESVREIQGLQPLKQVIGLASDQGLFASCGADEDDVEEGTSPQYQ